VISSPAFRIVFPTIVQVYAGGRSRDFFDESDREDIMKIVARCSFLLVTVLWGSFYAVAKAALTHIDPIIFTFFEAMVLVPIALTLILMQRHTLNRAALKRDMLLGSCLCIATLTITVSEKFTDATSTAFFPSTGAVFAAVITATVFGRSLGKSIWTACLLSLIGVFLILRTSLSGLQLRGDIIALLGALLFTVYLFLVDQDAQQEGKQFWAILGVEHLCFALWMILFSLLFGDWQHSRYPHCCVCCVGLYIPPGHSDALRTSIH
jgi:drug/metabolite transporter (DMT)-like permease